MPMPLRYGFLASSAILLAFAGAAQADGLFGQPVAPADVYYNRFLPPFTWTGFYLGANIGGGWFTGTATDFASGITLSEDHSGVIGGGQLGYNYQIKNYVVGVEWDFDATSINHRGSATTIPLVGTVSASAETRWVTTLAARAGVIGDSWMAYIKAGGGWAHTHASVSNLTTSTVDSQTDTAGGWLVGAGVEYALTDRWILKLEYDYLNLSNRTLPGFIANDSFSVDRNLQMLKGGLNFKF